MAEGMKASLGQPVVIENVSGAGGTIRVGRVARSAPNGYTLGLGISATHVVNGAIYTLSYDLLKDFEPISLIATGPSVIVSKNGVPAQDLPQLIAWLKANPGKATFATNGAGSPPHIAGILLEKLTDTHLQFVPYRGAAPAMQDLLGGQVDLSILQATVVLPQARAGKLRAYAVTATRRIDSAPDIPTVDEAGLQGLYISIWSALWAPRGTPRNVVGTLNAALTVALTDPTVRRRLAESGQEIFPREQQTPAALAALQKAEIEKWWPIIKAANIKAE
ncbi:MAG TPA: tripartite tricarboxylate transporter substrate-binding protein [Burkholderiales bacterium]|nr:tripartite tricarboxylate transporter substrate-binding protein [Burkholderiales bacterium]